ncbi:hypothetical protein [Kocuria sp.]|uniref:hypothetical protein n=1 Tax=Kocuria sp. TaxID=1871328 RepID=UPI0026E0E78B|nr:hypothetical protein [Kocuria sp.]MDO5619652.1 hypothetical protein [Kocuria sp.]
MTIAAECARMAVSPTTITTRQETSGGLPVDAVLYPEQVAFARVLTRGSLLAWATDPATDPVDVRSALDAESRRIVPATEDNEPWRASTRMQTVLFALRSHRRQQYLAPGAAVQPDRWNLLRHSDELGLPAAVAGVLSAVG